MQQYTNVDLNAQSGINDREPEVIPVQSLMGMKPMVTTHVGRVSQSLNYQTLYRVSHQPKQSIASRDTTRFLNEVTSSIYNIHFDNQSHPVLRFASPKREIKQRSPRKIKRSQPPNADYVNTLRVRSTRPSTCFDYNQNNVSAPIKTFPRTPPSRHLGNTAISESEYRSLTLSRVKYYMSQENPENET